MQNKHPIITYAYHFISEAIILFLLTLPIMYYYFDWVPYGSYFTIIVGLCIVFSIYVNVSSSYALYIITTPIVMIVFYFSSYPIVLSILFPVILTWRYINIRSETMLERENGYIRLTLLIATGLVLLIGDFQIVLYAFLQFLIMIVGYISSHLTVINKEERKRFDRKLWLYISSIFAAGTIIVFLLFDSGRYVFLKIGEWLSYLAAVVASKTAVLFQFLDFNKAQFPSESSSMGQQQDQLNQMQQAETSALEKILPYVYWSIAILITGVVIYIVIRIFKNRFVVKSQDGVSEAISYGDLDDNKKNNQTFIGKFLRSTKPGHPVRKLVYQFEKTAAKNGYGRDPYETLEGWLDRIGIEDSFLIYQKVRYGQKVVSDQEVNKLREQLHQVEVKLNRSNLS